MRRALLAIVVVLVVAACGGSSKISGDNLGDLVLTRGDVGRVFSEFANNPQITADNAGTPRADPSRFGREGGWVARFRRAGTKATVGPLIVESRVDVFSSSRGAKSDFAEYRAMLLGQDGAVAKTVRAPAVGEEAVETTFTQGGVLPVRFFRVAWRYRNATASLTVEGWDGKLRASEVASLARRQQNRLAQR
jgi:hypothetical protein